MTDTMEFLTKIMNRYKVNNLKIPKEEFMKGINYYKTLEDSEYSEEERDVQREQSIKFRWGHNHDFGEFYPMQGEMKSRHLGIMEAFIDFFDLPRDLTGKKVRDVGIWTGGTTLLLAGMGAKLDCVEEVSMYAQCADFLFKSFGLDVFVYDGSLYEFYSDKMEYDYIIFPGVLYHLSDPILALRMMFNMLKDGGRLYIETMTTPHGGNEPIIEYYGSTKGGWNWFAPNYPALRNMLLDVGFWLKYDPLIRNNRILTCATRLKWQPMVKAGLSRNIK